MITLGALYWMWTNSKKYRR